MLNLLKCLNQSLESGSVSQASLNQGDLEPNFLSSHLFLPAMKQRLSFETSFPPNGC